MKKLFDRHQNRLSVQEDRKVWSTLSDAVSKPEKKKRSLWVPSIALSGVAALIAVFVLGPDQLTQGTQEAFKQPGADIALQSEPDMEALRAVPYLDGSDQSADELRDLRAQTLKGEDAPEGDAILNDETTRLKDQDNSEAKSLQKEDRQESAGFSKAEDLDAQGGRELSIPVKEEGSTYREDQKKQAASGVASNDLSKPVRSGVPSDQKVPVAGSKVVAEKVEGTADRAPLSESPGSSYGAHPVPTEQKAAPPTPVTEAEVMEEAGALKKTGALEEAGALGEAEDRDEFLGWAEPSTPMVEQGGNENLLRRRIQTMAQESEPDDSPKLRRNAKPSSGDDGASPSFQKTTENLAADAVSTIKNKTARGKFWSTSERTRLSVAPALSSRAYEAVAKGIRAGQLPELQEVQVESFLNQVRVQPSATEKPVSLVLEAAPSPFGEATTLLRIQLFTGTPEGSAQLVARNTRVEVEFEPRAVEGFRLLGYATPKPPTKLGAVSSPRGADLYQNSSTTTLVELQLGSGNAPSALAVVRVRYEDPSTGRVEEISESLMPSDVEPRWENTDPSFVIDAVMAEFAETLQEPDSPFHDLYEVLGFARLAKDRIGPDHPFHNELPVLQEAARLLREDKQQR
ncbi:MAG: hypothetical protein HKN21_11010 [Candidatus Eisenbacteria bacterium]|uniref:DUF3520 domain-containing protein n=1 Tax=Eiseniibacteriota bacterium TaxID=2212470 RepID=A0A7Y2H2N3_UNCEI|nr:hypothetical protein [Candidatus Eisenbacteria bacterium]